jgi:hypothetical protein
MSGVKGQRWYHRYHQSYKTKPTRSGKVGTEHFLIDPTTGLQKDSEPKEQKEQIIKNLKMLYGKDQIIPKDAPLYRTQQGNEIESDDKIYVTTFQTDRQFWKDIQFRNKELLLSANDNLKIPSINNQKKIINDVLYKKAGPTTTDYHKVLAYIKISNSRKEFYNYVDKLCKNKIDADIIKSYVDTAATAGGSISTEEADRRWNSIATFNRVYRLTMTGNPGNDRSLYLMQALGSNRINYIYNDIQKELSKKYNGMIDYAAISTSENYYPLILFDKNKIKINKVNDYKNKNILTAFPLLFPGMNIFYMPITKKQIQKYNYHQQYKATNLFQENDIMKAYNHVYSEYIKKQKPNSSVVKKQLANYTKEYKKEYKNYIKKYKI